MTTTSQSPSTNSPPVAEQATAGADAIAVLRGAIGGILGGVIGYILFRVLLRYGLYALVLPGAAIGIGAAALGRVHSRPLSIACAVAALGLGLFAEWQRAPFRADPSFAFFVTHLHRLDAAPVTLLMIAVGTACAYWLAQGR